MIKKYIYIKYLCNKKYHYEEKNTKRKYEY